MSASEEASRETTTEDQIEAAGVQISERDIVFECPHCRGELVVDRDGAGLELNCSHCGKPVTVPAYQGPSLHFLQAMTAKLSDALRTARNKPPKRYDFEGKSSEDLQDHSRELQSQLRELQTQSSEIRALINHSRIQLHRYQLKLEMLHERQTDLRNELESLTKIVAQPAQPEQMRQGEQAEQR
jgi:ribosomal protein L37AE/L43A